jgi:ERO1-like protein alpha
MKNIAKLMDCVECEKCKVFGKMQVYGIGTVLKLVFTNDIIKTLERLKRNEIIVLINAFIKCASSLEVVDKMFERRFQDRLRIG